MRSWLRRAVIAVVAASLVAVGLSGCSLLQNTAGYPVAFTMVGSTAVMRLFAPVTLSSIDVFDAGNTSASVYEWQVEGKADFAAGAQVRFGSVPDGFTNTQGSPGDFGPYQAEVEFGGKTPRGQSFDVDTKFDAGKLKPGVWLDGRGRTTSVPCQPPNCDECTGTWPASTQAENPDPAHVTTAKPKPEVDGVSFTLRDGVPIAHVCKVAKINATMLQESQDVSGDTHYFEPVLDTYLSHNVHSKTLAVGTEIPVGEVPAGFHVTLGGTSTVDLTKGFFQYSLESSSDNIDADLVGTVNTADLAAGVWLDANGRAELTACSAYAAAAVS